MFPRGLLLLPIAANPGSFQEQVAFRALRVMRCRCSRIPREPHRSGRVSEAGRHARWATDGSAKRRIIAQRIDEFQARRRAGCHADGNGAIQFHDRRRRDFREFGVQRHDPRPVGFFGSGGSRVTSGDRAPGSHTGPRCRRVARARSSAARPRWISKLVPLRPILIEQQNGFSR